MKVLMISWEYPPRSVGGLARHVRHLSRALVRAGASVYVVAPGDEPQKTREIDDGVKVFRAMPYRLNPPGFVPWALQLNVAMLERAIEAVRDIGGVDLVHCHDWLGALAARALKHAYRIPLVATIHATENGRQQGIHDAWQRYIGDIEWWLTYESWRVVCCSEYMRRELQGLFQVPEDKIRVIRNGVEPSEFGVSPGVRHGKGPRPTTNGPVEQGLAAHDPLANRPGVLGPAARCRTTLDATTHKREEFAHATERLVFFVGRLVPEKGVQVLLDAMREVRRVVPLTRLVVAGTGPSESWLKAKAAQAGIGECVRFTGYIDDSTRNALYSWADVAVFPSTYEPFGLVALEAMAARCPVVVSDCGGLAETVEHGVDGLKCMPGDPASLAREIVHVLMDPAYAAYLEANAFRKVTSGYTWDSVAGETLRVYEGVLAGHRQSAWGTETQGRITLLGRYTRV